MREGVVVVDAILAPKDPIVPGYVPQSEYPNPPPLRRFSDWLFVSWQKFCNDENTDVQSLQWVVHGTVTNPSCNDAALLAIGANRGDNVKWPPFPGHVFKLPNGDLSPPDPDPNDEETAINNFNALVGCPNGYGTAFMLSQRQESLGHMGIDQVNVFGTNGIGFLAMAWHLASQ